MPVVDVLGAKISYTDRGAGQPVVLLHSSASSGAQWRDLGERLAVGYRVLAPDLHGYGGSDGWPERRPLTLADEADLVAAMMAICGEPVHLVGHSYGGVVAMRAALEHPDQLRSLTLIEPVAFNLLRDGGPAERNLFDEIAQVAKTISGAAESGDDWNGMARFIDYWSGEGTWSQFRIETRSALSRCIGKVAQDFRAIFSETVPITAFRRVCVPTLILYGADTKPVTRRISELLATTMPDARLQAIGGAGHMLPLTHRELVNTAIAEHLLGTADEQRRAA